MVRAAHPDSPLDALIAAATGDGPARATRPRNSRTRSPSSRSTSAIRSSTCTRWRCRGRHVAGYRALLKEAIAAGELKPHDTLRMARAINAMAGGSLIAWAIFREGTAERWVKRDLETLLAPYRVKP